MSGQDGVDHVRRKLVLLDLATCSVDLAFDVNGVNNRVDGLEFEQGRLFISGAFTRVGTHNTVLVAELDPTTGTADRDFTVEGDLGDKAASRALEMNHAGDRLVVAATDVEEVTIGAQTVRASATYMFDISDRNAPRLTPHEWEERNGDKALHGAGINDNADAAALAYHKHVFYAELLEGPTHTKWSHNNGDGTFDAAVSNNAVVRAGEVR